MKRAISSAVAVAAMSAGLTVSAGAAPAQAAAVTCSIDVGSILQGGNNRYAVAKVRCNGARNVSWKTKMYIKTGGVWRDGAYLGNVNMTKSKTWTVLNTSTWQQHTVSGQEDKCEYLVTTDVYYSIPGDSVRRSKGDSVSRNFCG